jgi:hypothetical protein
MLRDVSDTLADAESAVGVLEPVGDLEPRARVTAHDVVAAA